MIRCVQVFYFTDTEYVSGPNYNPATSTFTCSEQGAHYFSTAIAIRECQPNPVSDPDRCRVAITKNNAIVAGATHLLASPYKHLTLSVITECVPGDHINVWARQGSVFIEGSSVGRETRFSGHLIFAKPNY